MLKRHEQTAPPDMMDTSSRVFQKDGKRLSIRLENIYWDQLEDIAETDAISLNSLIFRISGDLASGVNKTAALRTYCVYRMRQEMVLTSIRTGNIDLAAIITACPQPVMVLTPERRIAAYNPAFVSDILARGSEKGDKAQKTPLRLTFSRPFNQIIRQVVDNPRTIISGQIGFTVGDRHTQRRVRYALADRSRGEESFIVAFVETAPEGTLRD